MIVFAAFTQCMIHLKFSHREDNKQKPPDTQGVL